MPVEHDLTQDIGISRSELEQRTEQDPDLARLLEDYRSTDLKIVELERAAGLGVSDKHLNRLKSERLLAKDRIVRRLQYGS